MPWHISNAPWAPWEAALIETIDSLHDRSTLSDGEFARLAAHCNSDQIREIIQITGQYHTISYLAAGLALPLQDGAARFAD
jgi:alkylhydroperoxidase family enzyme